MRSVRNCFTKEELLSLINYPADDHSKDHLLSCDLCSEALENLSEHTNLAYHLNTLNQDISLKYHAGIRTFTNRGWYYSAASVILITALLYSFFFTTVQVDKLFSEYYKPYPVVIPMVRGEGIDFDLKASMILYNSGNFSLAVVEFDKVLSIDPSNESAKFYKAISLMSMEEYEKAAGILSQIREDEKSMFSDQAEWYYALASIAMGNKAEAELTLKSTINKQNYYSNRSAELLTKLLSDD